MNELLRKKGQVSSLAPAILSLVFAAIILVFGIIISQSMRDTDVMFNSVTTLNEFPARANSTGYTLTGEDGDRTQGFTITSMKNATTKGLGFYNLTIDAANYTVNSVTGVVTNATTYNLFSNVSINYTYSRGDEGWESTNKTLSGLGSFGDFWEIIVLAVIITIVIGLLLVVFGGRKER